jgi:hypothetical protein
MASIDACITQCGLDVVCSKYPSLDCDLTRCAQKCDETSCAPDFAPACLDQVAVCKAQCEAQYPTPYSQIQKCAVDPTICGSACSGGNIAMEASSVCRVKPLPDTGVRPPDRGVEAPDVAVVRDSAPDKAPIDR